EELIRRVQSLVRESSLHQLLRSAVSCEVGAVERSHQRRISKLGIRSGIGIRQGMPLSPFFSNVLLREFDEALVKRQYQAVRYADDLIFFADSEAECLKIFDYCRAELGGWPDPIGWSGFNLSS
uniref:reverse transcriptase domain-containing protein n=1 Tax=Alcaligenes xylosoxydans xylosoxydans TaxID=85698 RepID=UPI001F1392BC